MALNSTGAISLGGSTSGQSVNLELSKSAAVQCAFNDTDVRQLTGTTSGSTLTMPTNFYGKAAVSPYVARTSGVTFDLGTVRFVNSRFVTGSHYAGDTRIITSTNGTTWSIITPSGVPTTNPTYPDLVGFIDIAYGAGVYVGITTRAVYTSTNLTSWTERLVPGSDSFPDIIRSNSVFIYQPASSLNYYRSTDGITWTQGSLNIKPLATNGTRLVGANVYDGTYIYTSDDNGVTWTIRYTFTGSESMPRGGTWTGTSFILPCADGSIFSSVDGVSWSYLDSYIGMSVNTSRNNSREGGSKILIVSNSTTSRGSIDSGSTWTPYSVPTTVAGAAYGASLFVVTGPGGKIYTLSI